MKKDRSSFLIWRITHYLASLSGIRKLRWARQGMGKSSGVRALYYYYNEKMPLYILTIYGKGKKANITATEKNELSKLVKLLVGFWIKKK